MKHLFGTDGIRGIVGKELDSLLAMNVGRAIASVIGRDCDKPVFILGGDTRQSSPMLGCALCAGLCSAGADVISVGIAPTPTLSYLTIKTQASAGIVVSASHNTWESNGIKLFSSAGTKFPDIIEEEIEHRTALLFYEPRLNCQSNCSARVGTIRTAQNYTEAYISHLCDIFRENTTEPDKKGIYSSRGGSLRIGVDCANGAAYITAPRIFESIGICAEFIGITPNGTNINLHCGSTDISELKALVAERGLDCGIAFDGDADRLIMVDEGCNEIDGDILMAICIQDLLEKGELKNDIVVGTVMSNQGLADFCRRKSIRLVAAGVGDKYVHEEMINEGAVFGGEPSGHIIFKNYADTGDGQLTALMVLSIMLRKKLPLSALAEDFHRVPQYSMNIPIDPECKPRFYTDRLICNAVEQARTMLGEGGKLIARPSGTEACIRITAECENADAAAAAVGLIADAVREQLKN